MNDTEVSIGSTAPTKTLQIFQLITLSVGLTRVTGGRPVPSETITDGCAASHSFPRACRVVLYSKISVSISNVGLLEISPPSINRPKALQKAKTRLKECRNVVYNRYETFYLPIPMLF